MEEEKKQTSLFYYLMFVLVCIAIISLFLSGLMIKEGRFFGKKETESEKVRKATLVYQATTKSYTEEQWKQTIAIIKKRMELLNIKGTVRADSLEKIEVQMNRDFAGKQNIDQLTKEDHILFYVPLKQKPTKKEMEQESYVESGGKYYRQILNETLIDEIKCTEYVAERDRKLLSIFDITLKKEGRNALRQYLEEQKQFDVYIFYDEEMLACETMDQNFNGRSIRFRNSLSIMRALYMKDRIENGNLPVELKLIENNQ